MRCSPLLRPALQSSISRANRDSDTAPRHGIRSSARAGVAAEEIDDAIRNCKSVHSELDAATEHRRRAPQLLPLGARLTHSTYRGSAAPRLCARVPVVGRQECPAAAPPVRIQCGRQHAWLGNRDSCVGGFGAATCGTDHIPPIHVARSPCLFVGRAAIAPRLIPVPEPVRDFLPRPCRRSPGRRDSRFIGHSPALICSLLVRPEVSIHPRRASSNRSIPPWHRMDNGCERSTAPARVRLHHQPTRETARAVALPPHRTKRSSQFAAIVCMLVQICMSGPTNPPAPDGRRGSGPSVAAIAAFLALQTTPRKTTSIIMHPLCASRAGRRTSCRRTPCSHPVPALDWPRPCIHDGDYWCANWAEPPANGRSTVATGMSSMPAESPGNGHGHHR